METNRTVLLSIALASSFIVACATELAPLNEGRSFGIRYEFIDDENQENSRGVAISPEDGFFFTYTPPLKEEEVEFQDYNTGAFVTFPRKKIIEAPMFRIAIPRSSEMKEWSSYGRSCRKLTEDVNAYVAACKSDDTVFEFSFDSQIGITWVDIACDLQTVCRYKLVTGLGVLNASQVGEYLTSPR